MPSAAGPTVYCTYFDSLYHPERWSGGAHSWADWAGNLARDGHKAYLRKDSVPLIGLYELREGGSRGSRDVVRYHGVCLDFDAVDRAAVIETVAALQHDGVSCLWHTTWSHSLEGKGECRRLIVPLAAPVPAAQYPALIAQIRAKYAPALDLGATQRSQAFYLPSCPEDRLDQAELLLLPGGGLRFDLTRHTEGSAPEEQPVSLSQDIWSGVAKRWLKSTNTSRYELGSRLKRVSEGVRFAESGERDSTLWRLLVAMAREFPTASEESVTALFRLSIDRMAEDGEGCLTLADVAEKLARARAVVRDESRVDLPPARRAAIRQAYGSSREEPYTAGEIEEITERLGIDPETLEHSWVLQHNKTYYLVGPHAEIVCCQREALANVARVILAPAPVDLYVIDDGRRRLLRVDELLERYSLPLADVQLSLVLRYPQFDLPRRVLTLPACPPRQIRPKPSAEIDQWLQLLAGPLYGQLCQWLHHVPDLSRPLAALVLTGPKSVGKSLLAKGLARIWSTGGASSLEHALAPHNTVIQRCPFVHADEGEIPRDATGQERTSALRGFIQDTERQINPKYRDLVTLVGCTRLQISANNDDVLSLSGGLTAHDVDAIAARFFHVSADGAAGLYLERIGGREKLSEWVEQDGLAAHCLWLATTGLPWEGRFGISHQQGLVARMLVRNGARALICELCVRALRDPTPLQPGAQVVGVNLQISLDWITLSWEVHLRKARQPATAALIRALDGLGERVLTSSGEGVFSIHLDRLTAWAIESGLGSEAAVTRWIEGHR